MNKLMRGLPLPDPWRLIFRDIASLETESTQYSLLSRVANGGPKCLANGSVDHWNVDQNRALFFATLSDGQRLEAKLQFLGSFDGETFLWADANPSIHDTLCEPAKATRTALPPELASIGRTDKCKLDHRSSRVLLGLAAEICDCDLVAMMPSEHSDVALVLSDVKLFRRAPAPPERKGGILRRLFGKGDAQTEPPSIAEQLANLRKTVNTALNQWQKELLTDDQLRDLEPKLIRAHQAMIENKPETALEIISDIQTQMGPYPQDQEPTGWVYLCEGMAAAELGDGQRAIDAFKIASRAVIPVSACLLRVARSRLATDDDRLHHLASAYVLAPADFQDLASEAEVASVKDLLQAASDSRANEDPESVFQNVIDRMCKIEIAAFERSKAAEAEREQRHVLCEADTRATLASNKEYLEFLVTWATPDRHPGLGSYSSDPSEAPGLIEDIQSHKIDAHTFEALVSFKHAFLSDPSKVKYVLRKVAIPLTNAEHWRLDQIVKDPDQDPYRVF